MESLLDNPRTQIILKVIKKHTNISFEEINIKSRKRKIVNTRQLMYYLMCKNTKNSLARIGTIFNQDHATVLHAKRATENIIDTDRYYRKIVEEIQKEITALFNGAELKSKVFKDLLTELDIEPSMREKYTERFEKAF